MTFRYLQNYVIDFTENEKFYQRELTHLTFYRGLRPFVVEYYGCERVTYENDEEEVKLRYRVQLRNMAFKENNKVEPMSLLDIKMGTNTVLKTSEDPYYKQFCERDKKTTSEQYGVRITGF